MNATRDQVIAADLETVGSEELEAAGDLYDAVRQSNVPRMCRTSGTLIKTVGGTEWFVVDGVVWRIDSNGRADWMGSYPGWRVSQRLMEKRYGAVCALDHDPEAN